MKITFEWLIQNKLLVVRLPEVITLDDIPPVVDDYLAILEELKQIKAQNSDTLPQIHVLHDATRLKTLKGSIVDFRKEAASVFRNPLTGWTISYGIRYQSLVFIFSIILKMVKAKHRIMDAETDALQFLAGVDDTLDISRLLNKD